MTYEEKKGYAINFILLGLEEEKALYHAGMTTEEIEKTRVDESFKEKVEFSIQEEHMRLRELYKDTAERNAKQRNDWRGVLSLLETSFPDKYKSKTTELPVQKVLLLTKDDEKL